MSLPLDKKRNWILFRAVASTQHSAQQGATLKKKVFQRQSNSILALHEYFKNPIYTSVFLVLQNIVRCLHLAQRTKKGNIYKILNNLDEGGASSN